MSTPYELLVRFGTDGSIVGMSQRTIVTVNGTTIVSSPQPVDLNDATYTQFASDFNAAAVAELASARDTITDLQEQLETLAEHLGDRRWINPDAFQDRFTKAEIRAMAASTDPVVASVGAQLDTVAAEGRLMNLDDTDTVNGLAYLVSKGILTVERKAEILAHSTAAERKIG